MTRPDRGRRWKGELIPFDAVSALSDDKHCYKLSERTVAILLAQTNYLYWQTRWSKEGEFSDAEKALIRDMASEVEHELMLVDQCEECFDYPLSSSIVDIEPMNPYTHPGELTSGYPVTPAWTILTADVPFTALKTGDMLAGAPTTGADYPRIRVNVTGEVLVEVHFVPIPFGGMLQIQEDGTLDSLRYVDLNADIASVPPEVEPELVVEAKFTGTGDHFLDITVLPRFNDEVEFLGIGGGLRKITICGQQQECPDMPFDVRQSEDDPCELDKSTDDGEPWSPWANLRLCPPKLIQLGGGVIGVVMPDDTVIPTATGDPTYDGREHAPPPAPRGGSATDNKCLAAANAVNVLLALHGTVMQNIDVPLELSIAAAIAGLLIALLFLPIAIGLIIIAIDGLLTIAAGLTYGSFDSTTQDTLRCILDCAATDTAGVVTFDFASVQSQVTALSAGLDIWAAIYKYLSIIGESGLNLAGATTAITTADCSDCTCGDGLWDRKWNFAEGLGPWSIVWGTTDAAGVKMADSMGGWPSVARVDLTVEIPSGSHLTGLRMWYCDPTGTSSFTSYGVHGYGEGGGGEYWELNNSAAPNGNMSISSDNTGTLHLTVFCTYPYTGGQARMTGVEMVGDGDPPALTSLASTWPPATSC